MPHKGQFKKPVQALDVAFARAMESIDSYGACAVFMIGGKISASKRGGSSFEKRMQLFSNSLIGVYDEGVDARRLREDIEVFYQ